MTDPSATKFELWKTRTGYALFAEDNASARSLLEPDAKLAWTVQARSWAEARKRMYAFVNREPYRADD